MNLKRVVLAGVVAWMVSLPLVVEMMIYGAVVGLIYKPLTSARARAATV
jgi:hypothetical protein